MIKNKSKNLFDGTYIPDVFISPSTGSLSPVIGGRVTNFIEIKPNTTYTMKVDDRGTVGFYNINQTFISSIDNGALPTNSVITFTSPANTVFVRVYYSRFGNSVADIQLELGSTATAYVPYNDIQVAVGQFEQGQGKNLFDGQLELGLYNNSTGVKDNISTCVRNVNFIPVLPNTTYTISNNNNYSNIIYAYNQNQSFIQIIGNVSSPNPYTFTTTSNTYFINFRTRTAEVQNDLTTLFQLELGNTATTYEPYKYLAIHNPASNDIPIPALNNKTLNEVFVGGQLITNSSLTTTSNWTVLNSTNSVLNNELINTGNGTSTSPLTFATISNGTTSINPNVVVYGRVTLRVDNSNATSISVRSGNGQYGVIQNTPLINQPYNLSFKGLSTVATSAFVVRHFYDTTALANGAKIFIKEPLLIDLTSLGIASVTQAQMDAYFQAWQRNNAGTLLANTFIQHDQNSVPIADLNGKTLDEVFIGGQVNTFVTSVSNVNGILIDRSLSPNLITVNGTATGTVNASIYTDLISTSSYYLIHNYISGTHSRRFINSASATIISEANMQQNNTLILTNSTDIRLSHINGTVADNYTFAMPLINLTALGITATKEQLDFWFSVWQQNHKLGMRVHRASGNDIPLAVLNNQSLNQVFVGGQLLLNNEFSNGTTNWDLRSNTSQNVVDGVNTITATATGTTIGIQQVGFTTNLSYVNIRFNPQSSNNLNVADGGGNFIFSVTPNIWQNKSGIRASTDTTFRIYQSMTSGQSLQVDSVVAINLTSLGIATLTKSQLDYLFTVWQFNTLNALVARQFIQEA